MTGSILPQLDLSNQIKNFLEINGFFLPNQFKKIYVAQIKIKWLEPQRHTFLGTKNKPVFSYDNFHLKGVTLNYLKSKCTLNKNASNVIANAIILYIEVLTVLNIIFEKNLDYFKLTGYPFHFALQIIMTSLSLQNIKLLKNSWLH